jgi:polysaccharide biosynthesis/export protein
MKTIEKARTQLGTRVSRAIALLVIASCTTYGSTLQTDRSNKAGQATGASPSGSVAQPGGRGATAVFVSPEEDYRIGPNDVIDVKVDGAPELTQTYQVTAAGTFLMPWVGRVTAVKKTTEELAQYIADKLRGDYLKDPKVSVLIREFNSRSFFIHGSVRSPGVFKIEGRPSMLELIALAGGLSEHHGANAYIIRRIKAPAEKEPGTDITKTSAANSANAARDAAAEDAPKYEMKSANINALFKGHFEQDVLLEPGDMIDIPPTDVFFVAGEVNAPGSFSLKEGTTLRQAISLAQGTKFEAAQSRGIVFRENSSGKREEVHVDIGAVMSGKKEDVAIMANDIIMVPNSRSKSIGGVILKAFGMATITRVPIP